MKKKNSIYPIINGCLLDENIIYEHFREEFVTIIDKFNDYNNPLSTKIASDGTIEGLTKKDNFFFSNLYVPAIPLRTVDELRQKLLSDIAENEIGILEWQLILFCTSFGKSFQNNRIIFVTGNVGEGKSSLINYVLKYLYINRKSLKNRILPIILNCQGHYTKLKREKEKNGDIVSFIDDFIKKNLNNKLKNDTTPDNIDFWDWYKKQAFATNYSSEMLDIEHSRLKEEDLQRETFELRKKEKKENPYFPYYSAYYVVQKQKKEIVFVFENVDPFDIDIITDFYWKAKFIVNNSPIKVIISLRQNTYRKLEKLIAEVSIIRTISIKSDLKKILESRCEFLENQIKLQEVKKPLILSIYGDKSVTIKISPYSAIKKITQAILTDYGQNCVVTFSNRNIRNQLELLRIVFSSGLLSSSEMGKILLQEDSTTGIPPELLISTISTFGHGTFFSKIAKQLDVPGVINVLSSTYHKYPIQIFTKLYILSYLNNKGFEIDNDKNEIINIFQQITSKMRDNKDLLDSFIYSFYRLFNKGLISSPDIHFTKSKNEFIETVEEIRISALGEYYYETLIESPFYLFFIKDDVYLNDISSFEDSLSILKNYNPNRYFWLNFKNLISFLKEYGQLELDSIKQFVNYNCFDIFNNNFGCNGSKLFTLKIIENLIQFIKSNSYKTNSLIYFIDNKQIFNTTDITELDNIKEHLETEYFNITQ